MRTSMLLLVAVLEVALGGAALAQSPVKGVVGIRFLTYNPSGEPTRGGGVAVDLTAGESDEMYVIAGPSSEDTACGMGGGAGSTSAQRKVMLDGPPLHVWDFSVTMVDITIDKISFDLVWERRTSSNVVARQSQRRTMREGESIPFDVVHGTPGSKCLTLVLELVAGIEEDPALVNTTIEWDIWTQSAQQSHRSTASSTQGEAVSFAFEPLNLANAGFTQSFLHVWGTLRGRVRSDGSIDVAVSPARVVSNSPTPTPLRRRSVLSMPPRESGTIRFVAQPGESVRVSLPPFAPNSRIVSKDDPRTGVTETTIRPPGAATPVSAITDMALVVRARIVKPAAQ